MIDNRNKVNEARDLLGSIIYRIGDDKGEIVAEKLRSAVVLFGDSPGGSVHHHGYRYGLLIHTAEVVTAAIGLGQALNADPANLMIAAILHDIGKTQDYKFVHKLSEPLPGYEGTVRQSIEVVEKTPGYQLGNHIIRSYDYFRGAFDGLLDRDSANTIGNAILSHHGRLEWSSPVTPSSPEGWALHLADMASAQSGVVL